MKPPKPPVKAFTQRLQELQDRAVKPSDPLLGEKFQSLIDKDPQLTKVSKDLDQRRFEHEHQATIQATSVPSYAPKQARDTAMSKPWNGTENYRDASLRMLIDRPSRAQKEAQRLGKVKERVIDFQLDKLSEEETFRTIYHEKFTPIGSFDKIQTLAERRIDEAMAQGQFDNIKRGELAVNVNPYVDRTEHHLNNILVTQNLVPPWIEKQGGVNLSIERFRAEMADRWMAHVRNYKGHAMRQEFRRQWEKFVEARIAAVNSTIRTYNLQAPMSTQKFYLLLDKEFERVYNVSITREPPAREAEAPKLEHKKSFWDRWLGIN